MAILFVILAGVLLGSVLGCEGEHWGNDKFIRGTARDSLSHVTVESVRVYLGSVHDTVTYLKGLTDKDGKYLVLVGLGTNSVGSSAIFEKQGYKRAVREFNTLHHDTTTVNILLSPIH